MTFHGLTLENKVGAVFSAAAFLLTLLVGIISGVKFGVTIVRSLICMPVFFGIGFGIIFVIKTYVPEVYEMLVEASSKEEPVVSNSINQDEVEIAHEESSEGTRESNPEFTELSEKDFDKYSTLGDDGLNTAFNASTGKLGKHIVVDEKFSSYEPKIMAQAIRTMMSKDKD